MTSANTINLSIDATGAGLPADTRVYMYIVGLVSTDSGDTYYRLDTNGIPRVMDASDNSQPANSFPDSNELDPAAADAVKPNYPNAWADYSIPVALDKPSIINLANINPDNCPGLGTGTAAFSGRIYLSIGIPRLPFSPIGSPATGYTAPVFDHPPGHLTLFDWIEFSFDSETNFNGNTTQVDQFGFPLTLDGTPGGSLQGALNTSRSEIMTAFGAGLSGPLGQGSLQFAIPAAAAPAYPAGVGDLRVISPKTLTAAPYSGELLSFFDDEISKWYKVWETTPLVTYDQSTEYYTGIVPVSGSNKGELVFYQGNYATLNELKAADPALAFVLGKVTSYDIWQCTGTLANSSDGDPQLNVGKMIAAAFNRGVVSNTMDDATCQADAENFYPEGGTWNEWSQMFHDYSINKLAYGFAYDDVCEQNPSIGLTATTSVTITIGSLA